MEARKWGSNYCLPPGLAKKKKVRELWLFSENQGSWFDHTNRNFAEKRINEALEKASDPVTDKNAVPADTKQEWCQYQAPCGAKYWYREPDGLWFWETNDTWQRFFDDDRQRHWWWNTLNGTWFHEP